MDQGHSHVGLDDVGLAHVANAEKQVQLAISLNVKCILCAYPLSIISRLLLLHFAAD